MALPVRTVGFPHDISSEASPETDNISMLPGLYEPSEWLDTDFKFRVLPVHFFAAVKTPISPTTKGLHKWYSPESLKAERIISGPIPAGSPAVMPITGLFFFIEKPFINIKRIILQSRTYFFNNFQYDLIIKTCYEDNDKNKR
jgi:hypothetical protein